MALIRYLIRQLSVRLMLPYGKQTEEGTCTYALTPAQTESVLMGDGDTLQEDNAIFFQTMCVLHGDSFSQPTEDTIIRDLADVILYLDFSGIFDRNENDSKTAQMQKKTEAMFTSEGITLDFGHGKTRYLAFERSASMSRNARLSFLREDVFEPLRHRMTVGMKLGICQLSKLYAYNGLLFSSGTRIETDRLWDEDAIVVIDNPSAVCPDVDVVTVEDVTGTGSMRKYRRVEKKTDVTIELFDGEGLISPEFSEEIDTLFCGKHKHTSFQIRMPYIKGMIHQVDFRSLLREAHLDTVTDLWGHDHPADRVCLILTKSQFKGCGWMRENGLTFSEYLVRLRQFRHTLYITGVNSTNSEMLTELNYQFLSTLSLDMKQFRPQEISFEWEQIRDSKMQWLTKTTEEVYCRLLNDTGFQFDYYVDHAPKSCSSRRKRLADMLYRNDLLLSEKVYYQELEKAADTILQNYARGKLLVEGKVAYLSADLTPLLEKLLGLSIRVSGYPQHLYYKLCDSEIPVSSAYGIRRTGRAVILRNPHIARNEEAFVRMAPVKIPVWETYFSHLNGIVMVNPRSLIAERLGGADYDGDMVKVIFDPTICKCVMSHYWEPKSYFEEAFSNAMNLPLLHIPTAEPQLRDANDWKARYETVKSTFSSRVGQISNAALDRSMIAYNESADDTIREQCRKETETLAILTGLEIDSVKSGIKPDLSEYLEHPSVERSIFLRYKQLVDDAAQRPAWHETTLVKKMKAYIEAYDWNTVTSNVEKLPYYAYMLKKCNPRKKHVPAPASAIFSFARHANWQSLLKPELFPLIKNIIDTYDRCLRRIRSDRHPVLGNSKKNDILRILALREQDAVYSAEELSALFSEMDAPRIHTVLEAIRNETWHFMASEKRLVFLREYLPEEAFRPYDSLFADFRMGGYRILGDILCDIDDSNRRRDLSSLHRPNDTPEMTAMIDAFIHREPGTDYREAIASVCAQCLCRITPGFQAIRYAEALGRRDFIFDVLLNEAEFYLIGDDTDAG